MYICTVKYNFKVYRYEFYSLKKCKQFLFSDWLHLQNIIHLFKWKKIKFLRKIKQYHSDIFINGSMPTSRVLLESLIKYHTLRSLKEI